MALLNLPTTLPNGYVPTIDEWNTTYFNAINTRVNDVTYDQVSTSLAIDEDNMVSDSASNFPTQQSVKAYVDGKTGGSSGGGSTSETLELLNEIEKAVGQPLGFTAKYSINNSFTYDDNIQATLSAAYTAGATAISMAYTSPAVAGALLPEDHIFYIYDKASSALEEFTFASAVAGNTYALNTPLVNSYASATTIIGRSFGNINVGAKQFEFSTISGASAVSANYYNDRINSDIPFILKTANIQAKFNTDTWFQVASVATATKQITVNVDSASARLSEIATATASDGNVMWIYNLVFNGNEYIQVGDGKRVTVTATSYSVPNAVLTVSEDITSSDVAAPTADQRSIYYMVLEPVKINLATGDHGTTESVVQVIPSRIKAYDQGIAYPTYVHSHWKLDETSGNAINAKAGATYDLTQTGTVPSTIGKIGNARGPFSSSNYFSWNAGGSSTTIYDTNNFIIEFWVKTTGAAENIIGKRAGSAGYWFETDSGNIKMTIWGATAITGASINDGNWHYIVGGCRASSGASEIRLYRDGASTGTPQSGVTWTKSTNNLVVGGATGFLTFTGFLDSVAYWSNVPSSWAEIEAIIAQRYNSGRGREYGLNIGHSLIANKQNISIAAGGYVTTQYKLIRNVTSGDGFYNTLISTQTNII